MDGAVPEGRWITSVMGGIIDRYFNNTQHTPVYTPDLSRPSFQDIYFVDNAFRLTWQVSSRNKVTFSQGYQKNCLCRMTFGGFAWSPEASTNLFRPYGAPLTQGTWTYPATNR